MFCNILKDWDPMVGVDIHITGLPIPSISPYATFFLMCGLEKTWKYSPTTLTHNGYTMLRGTDIGPFIPHIGPLTPVMVIAMFFSGSKSHFGSRRYLVTDQKGKKQQVAIACDSNINLNLNCGIPTPTFGLVLSIFCTHVTGVTLGDKVAGCILFFSDFLIQKFLNCIGHMLGKLFNCILCKIINRFMRDLCLILSIGRQLTPAFAGISNVSTIGIPITKINISQLTIFKSLVNQLFQRIILPTASPIVGSPTGLTISDFTKEDSLYEKARLNDYIEKCADELGDVVNEKNAANEYLDDPSTEIYGEKS